MKEITFNYDTTDLSSMIYESDRNIHLTIEKYRSLMTETLNESSGIINADAELIMEQASDHIGQKIMKILIVLKNWLVKTVQNIIAKLRALVGYNDKMLEKIRPAVEAKLKMQDSPLKTFKAQMYEYDLQEVLIGDISQVVKSAFETSEYNVDFNYIEAKPKQREMLDLSSRKIHNMSNNDILKALCGLPDLETVKETAYNKLRKNGARKTVVFDMKYFDIVASFKKVERLIQSSYNNIVDYIDTCMKDIDHQIKHMPTEHYKDDGVTEKIDKTKIISYLNAKRKIITVVTDMAVAINNERLRAAVEQMTEAKKFCIAAYQLKGLQETIFEPFVVVTNDATFIEDNDGLLEGQFKTW